MSAFQEQEAARWIERAKAHLVAQPRASAGTVIRIRPVLGEKWKPTHGGAGDLDTGFYWERNRPITGNALAWQTVLLSPVSERMQRRLDVIRQLRSPKA